MSGFVLPVVPKRVLDFSGVTSGTYQQFVLADRIELLHWQQLTMLVHVHNHTLTSGAGLIDIAALNQSWTEEEPDLVFVGPAYTTTITTATPNASLLSVTFPMTGAGCFGHMVRIVGSGTRAAAGALSAQVSVELSVKEA